MMMMMMMMMMMIIIIIIIIITIIKLHDVTFTGKRLPVESTYIIIIVLIYFLQSPVLNLRVPTAISNMIPAQQILKIALRILLVRCQPTNAVA